MVTVGVPGPKLRTFFVGKDSVVADTALTPVVVQPEDREVLVVARIDADLCGQTDSKLASS